MYKYLFSPDEACSIKLKLGLKENWLSSNYDQIVINYYIFIYPST